MYSQANVRAGKWLRPPPRALPSVIVDTEMVLWEADGPIKRAVPRPAMRDGWKVFAPGVRLKSRTVRAGEEPEEHKRQIWGKSAHMHIVRLMNNLVKGLKRMMTKVQ